MNNNFLQKYFNFRDNKSKENFLTKIFSVVDDQTKINIIEFLKLGNKKIQKIFSKIKK